MRLIRTGCVLLALLAVPLWAGSARAASLEQVGAFAEPMFLTSPPGEPNRLLVAERDGRLEQIEAGSVTRFADLRPVVSCCAEDRGLQSIAVAPDFASSGRVFVEYIDLGGNIEIAEIRASGRGASLSTLRGVLTIPYAADANHYGGQIQFGPEGDLYVATGDGGYGGRNDEHHNAQNLGTLLGKMLRIDPRPSGALPYSVPAGNPFAAAPAPYDTIWSYGLRNPYRFSFDPASGSIAIADVGEEQREEVDLLPLASSAGGDFGWNCREGALPGPATDPECAAPPAAGYVSPIFEYGHDRSAGAYGCAIIGGLVVRDPGLGDLYGRYLYADFCTADVRSFAPSNPAGSDRSEGFAVGEATSFGEDSCGRVYVLSRGGAVLRLTAGSTDPCLLAARIRVRAKSRAVSAGRRALITAAVSPCANRGGERIALYRGRKRLLAVRLSSTCTARFRPRVQRSAGYRVRLPPDAAYRAASSRRLLIHVERDASQAKPIDRGKHRSGAVGRP